MVQGFEAGRVAGARLLSPKVRNVTIAAESLAGFRFEPGADVTIRLPCDRGAAAFNGIFTWSDVVLRQKGFNFFGGIRPHPSFPARDEIPNSTQWRAMCAIDAVTGSAIRL